MAKENLFEKYFALMVDYSVNHEEKLLLDASDLGRSLIKEGVHLEEISEMHETAVRKLAENLPDKTLLESVQLISAPLMELLMSYGLASREMFESQKKTEIHNLRLATAVEQAGESILITDRTGVIVYVNPALERISGYPANEVVGKTPRLFKSNRHDADFYAQMWKTISQGNTWKGQMVNKRKNSEEYYLDCTISPVKDPDGRIINYVAVRRDVTREVELEKHLRQAQKMESVGRLAGGVAHDYNNMLSVIIGFTEAVKNELEPSSPFHDDLDEVLSAAKRATDITRQLLAFARKQTIAPKALDLNDNVENMLKMLRRLIGEDIDLAWLPANKLWSVNMDPSQIDQIMVNLCVNARDAIKGVGKVTIETRNTLFDEDYCTDHTGFVSGEFVMLAVSDNGCGMDKKILSTLFEPFFTTKEVGKGTGLGMATIYGIAKQNNGFINVYSEPGMGTTIKVFLPRHGGNFIKTQEESIMEIPPGQGKTILLVEDERSILRLVQKILTKLNYTLLTAATPGEAIKLAEEYTGKIHILLTDVIMPGMNGRQMADRLQSVFPDLKIIYMSGYTADVIAQHGVLDEGMNFLQKPFSKKDLAMLIRQTLDE